MHFNEIRAEFGFGGTHQLEYSFLLTELNGWLDGDSAIGARSAVAIKFILNPDSHKPITVYRVEFLLYAGRGAVNTVLRVGSVR